MSSNPKPNYVFIGSSRLSVIVLEEMARHDYLPTLIVTTPDKPVGRKQLLTPNVVKQWAISRNIRVIDPVKLTADVAEQLTGVGDLFIVASYAKIIPNLILNIPKFKCLNIHPSLLPKYRGPAPLPTAMLDDCKETGVTIMRMDDAMDHGPIIAQKIVKIEEWPVYEDFEEQMAKIGARLIVEIIPKWLEGKIEEIAQDESKATFTKKIEKLDGLLDLKDDPYMNFRKIQAFHHWPQAYFMYKHKDKEIRVKITSAKFADGKLNIEKVIPEGSKEMTFKDFCSGYGFIV